jgi:hypothetical protein
VRSAVSPAHGQNSRPSAVTGLVTSNKAQPAVLKFQCSCSLHPRIRHCFDQAANLLSAAVPEDDLSCQGNSHRESAAQ